MEVRAEGQHSPPTTAGSNATGNKTKYQGKEITALPTELIEKVFANLDGRDLVACQRVVKAWHSIIDSSPLLACAFYRRYHPFSLEPQSPLPVGIGSSYGETLGWLTRFSKEGCRSAAGLEKLLTRGQPRYLAQILFFTTARVLAQAKVFDDCYVCPIKCPIEDSWSVWNAQLSPDQRHLVVTCDGGAIVSRRRNGWWPHIATLPHDYTVGANNFSPHGDYFIAHCKNNTVQIWETSAEQWRMQATFSHYYLQRAYISRNGHFLILNGIDNTLQISRQVNGQWQEPVPLPDSEDTCCPTFLPLKDILVTRHHHTTFKIWRLAGQTWQLDATIKQSSYTHTIPLFSPDGQRLCLRDLEQHTLKIFYCADREWRAEITFQLADAIYSVTFSPKGNHLVATCYDPRAAFLETKYIVTLWRCSDNKWQEVTLLNTNRFRFACFSPDGDRLLIVSMDQTITLWRDVAGQWQQQATLPHLGGVNSACLSPHGYLAIACDKTVTIWGASAGQWQKKVDLAHDTPVHKITFSPDGLCLLAQHRASNTVNIWTLRCKDSGDGP